MCWQNSPFMQCPNVANTLRDGPLYNTDFFVIGELIFDYNFFIQNKLRKGCTKRLQVGVLMP